MIKVLFSKKSCPKSIDLFQTQKKFFKFLLPFTRHKPLKPNGGNRFFSIGADDIKHGRSALVENLLRRIDQM